ncbi:hypothetical protein AVEN_243264-1 [Araneus ventricosus]|uniref:Uncharacterized protein n=1 Tax=Araneus ventricosus TaxID=182803 RepID=A0A4Y2M7W7_ARAVE|nr:hypothetical protein AVEN_243264-1 [Araneus ventricosus]
MLQSLEILPFEVMEDAEVYGLAVSALAETRPLNKGSKHLLAEFIEEMADSTLSFEVPHPGDKKISNGLLANVMNSLSKSISEEMLGGKFLDSELEEAYESFKYNITEPNFFILYGRHFGALDTFFFAKSHGPQAFETDKIFYIKICTDYANKAKRTKKLSRNHKSITDSHFQENLRRKYGDQQPRNCPISY